MSVNQDNNTLVKRKRQIPEISKKHGFLNERVRTLKAVEAAILAKLHTTYIKYQKI